MRAWSIFTAFARAVRDAMTASIISNGIAGSGRVEWRSHTLFILRTQHARIIHGLTLPVHRFPLLVHLPNRLLRRLPFRILRCAVDRRGVPSAPGHEVHTDHLRFPGLDAVGQFAELQLQRCFGAVDLHALAFVVLVDALVDRERELAAHRCPFEHAGRVEGEEDGGFVVGV